MVVITTSPASGFVTGKDETMKQTERQTLQRRYCEMMARKAGVKFTPYNKKELVEWLQKELEKSEILFLGGE